MKRRRPSAWKRARRSSRICTTGEIRGAVNAGGIKLDLPPDEAPFADLARRIGALLAGVHRRRLQDHHPSRQRPARAEADDHAAAPGDGGTAQAALDDAGECDQRRACRQEPQYRAGDDLRARAAAGLVGDIVGVRVEGPNGESHRILGTVYADGLPRVLRMDNFAMDMVPEGQMVLILNNDQPGVIGTVGTTFGDAGVNIADMVISREKHADGTATALMVLKTDSSPTEAVLKRLKAHRLS